MPQLQQHVEQTFVIHTGSRHRMHKAECVSVSLADQHDLHLMQPSAPAISGPFLTASVALAESPLGPPVTHAVAKRTLSGLFKVLRKQTYPEEPKRCCIARDPHPELNCFQVTSADAAARVEAALQALSGHAALRPNACTVPNARPSILDYHRSFKAGMVTPNVVAECVIGFLETHNTQKRWLSAWSAQHIREAAAAATERYAAGKPLSVLDGVPFVVKDCIDALPYPTSYGTRFMAELHPVEADAPCTAALKELGAVLLGKGAMVEFGCLATGFNTHAGSTVNPHNPKKMSGGSSSGSAAAVAAGLCPIAIGTDGGGSIRIPSSYCGVMGLKTTKGRLADDHGAHGCFSSVTVTGPIATNAADLLLLYAALGNTNYPTQPSSRDSHGCHDSSTGGGSTASSSDPNCSDSKDGDMNGSRAAGNSAASGAGVAAAASIRAPPLQPLSLPCQMLPSRQEAAAGSASLQTLAGLRVGVYHQWLNMCSPGVKSLMQQVQQVLLKLGATLVPVVIPELELVQAAHMAVFSAEYHYDAGQAGWRDDWSLRKQLNLDTRMFYCNAAMFTAADYDTALRVRARAISHFERAFQECDVVLTPATPTTAPGLPAAVHAQGVYDVAQTLEAIRFTQAANLTGLPALVMPAGCVADEGMPVGLQLIGRHFAEATLLRAAAALEQCLQPVVPAGDTNAGLRMLQGHAAHDRLSADDTSPPGDQLRSTPAVPEKAKRSAVLQKGQHKGVLRLMRLLRGPGVTTTAADHLDSSCRPASS